MQKRITLLFDTEWVLSKKDDAKLPVEIIVEVFKEALDAKVLDASLTDCELLIPADASSDAELKSEVSSILRKIFAVETLKGVVECEISDYVPAKQDGFTAEPKKNNRVEKIMGRIHSLVGAESFKELAEECVAVAPGLLKYRTVSTLTNQAYLFAINEGDGMSTYLQLFAELLEALNLFRFKENNPVAEEKLLQERVKERGVDPFSPVRHHLSAGNSKGGKIISIDISEWMAKLTDKDFREFLSDLDDHRGEHIFVFRVPFLENKILGGIKKALADVLFVRDVPFVPFDYEELTRFAAESVAKLGFSMEADAWDVFRTRITEEKIDGRFYGINTVNKVVREMVYRKQLDNAKNGVDDTVVKKSEILSLASSYSVHEKSGEELLDDLVGVDAIRARVMEIIGQIEASATHPELGSPCIHMRFVGNPGTGKTTVARVIGKMLKERGILRNGHFFEYSGRDFCGRYVGETAPKTSAMCRDAYGSVLFIDEAYSLYRDDSVSSVDYGREAIDTLIAEMENHRSDLVIIMAGYPDEMGNLMKANPGLESRMPYIIEFPNYTRDQLHEIFMLMVKKSFTFEDGFDETVKEYFINLPEDLVTAKEFSNARFVRNLFERTWGKAVMRSQLNKDNPCILLKQDFVLASSENEFKKMLSKPSRNVGFI